MKLKLIFIISFAYLTHPLFSQNSGWELADNTVALVTSITEVDNGDLIAAMYPKDNLTKIVKLGKDGNKIFENYLFTDSIPIIIHKMVYIPSTERYLLLGSSYLKEVFNDTYKRYLVVSIMDTNLNIDTIKITKLDVSNEIVYMNYFINEDEKVFISINLFSQGALTERKQIFVALDKFGDIERYNIDNGHFDCHSIIKSDEGYQCIGLNIRNFDNNFNLIGSDNNNYAFINTYSQAVRINENRILIGLLGTRLPELSSGGAVLYYVDNNMDIIKKNWIKSELGPTTVNKVFDISPDSSIFISTIEAFDKNFSIGKFDKNLNLVWQIKYENIDKFNYRLWGMEATNDNGIILYGSRRRWNDFGFAESYMIKFNSEGKLVYTYNIPNADFLTIKSYPNPSSGPLTLDIQGLIGKAEIRVFDALGRNVYVQDGITDGNNAMDLSALQSGTYVYKIYQGGKEISSRQWVKI